MSTTETVPGTTLIANERQEQLTKHQYTVEGDVKFNNNDQLSEAASILCINAEGKLQEAYIETFEDTVPFQWNKQVWKRMLSKPYKERLTIAGALIAAEIDRVSALESKIVN